MKSIALGIAALSVLAAVSTGVVPYSTPYSTPYNLPIVERPAADDAGNFDGLLALAEALPPSTPLKVLWTHGMCTHPPGWVDDRLKRLADAIGGAPETVVVRDVGDHGASLRTERISVRSATIEVTFLTWSPLTAPYKAALDYDHSKGYGGEFPYARADLNRELKRGLINDCLTDVVIYGGANGREIREAANEAVCETLGGVFHRNKCTLSSGTAPAALAFVTESLGSKLLFDAILDVWGAAEASQDTEAINRLANSLAATRMMYMVANQVPLLDLAGPIAGGMVAEVEAARRKTTGSARGVFGLMSRARDLAPPAAKPMTVVAFSDPNDLLSYRIVPAHLTEDLKAFRVVNVIVSNDTTYFGYVERPDTAHCGYTWNPHVFGLLARGYQGKPLPSATGLAGAACPDYGRLAGPGALASTSRRQPL